LSSLSGRRLEEAAGNLRGEANMSVDERMPEQDLKSELQDVKTELAALQATQAGAEATQAATQAGQAATNAAAPLARGLPSSPSGSH
jgi:hypothetical protein